MCKHRYKDVEKKKSTCKACCPGQWFWGTWVRSPEGFPWLDEDWAIQTWHWAGLRCTEPAQPQVELILGESCR